jgi:hypothetical protein
MLDDADRTFLENLPILEDFESVTSFESYIPLPSDWLLALVDVVDSTTALKSGRYKAVNVAGVSAISALLNAFDRHDYPYSFGGDGALVALPSSAYSEALEVLSSLRAWTAEALDLDLRAALVPMEDVRLAGLDVTVGRYRASADVTYAMFSGGGATWAELQMKAGRYTVPRGSPGSRPDLTGLSCRWDPIPNHNGSVVSLLVMPGAGGANEEFRNVVLRVIGVVKQQSREAHPIPVCGPPISFTTKGVIYEARATNAGRLVVTKLRIVCETMLAVAMNRFGIKLAGFNAREYRNEVGLNSDFRKFDDGLKMTLDISAVRLNLIHAILEGAACSGTCKYGIHSQSEALMTCFVPTLSARDHVHFIDGAGGGYAMAARQLKAG